MSKWICLDGNPIREISLATTLYWKTHRVKEHLNGFYIKWTDTGCTNWKIESPSSLQSLMISFLRKTEVKICFVNFFFLFFDSHPRNRNCLILVQRIPHDVKSDLINFIFNCSYKRVTTLDWYNSSSKCTPCQNNTLSQHFH